jgi:hypothetical protein
MVYIFIIFLRGCGFEIGVGYKGGGILPNKTRKTTQGAKKTNMNETH